MRKRFMLSVVTLLLTGACYAQSTAKDSLRLKNPTGNDEELKLNKEAVKRIKFDNAPENPRISEEKNWMRFDEILPTIIPPLAINDSCGSDSTRLPLRKLKITMGLKLPPPEGISLGNGIRVNEGLISGLDILQVFTRDFWQFRKKQMRTRTLEVLKDYK